MVSEEDSRAVNVNINHNPLIADSYFRKIIFKFELSSVVKHFAVPQIIENTLSFEINCIKN